MSVNPRNTHVEVFIDAIQEIFISPHTRAYYGTTPSLLDLMFTNEANVINHIDYLPGLGNSDHLCICFHLSCYSTFKLNYIARYNVNRADFDDMCAAFYTIDCLVIMEPIDIYEAWRLSKIVLQDIIDKYVPKTEEKKYLYVP